MGNVALVVWAQDVENDEGQDRKILCCSLTAPVTDHWRHKSLVYAMTGSLWRYLPFLWVRLPAAVRKWAHKSRQEFCWGSGTNLPGKPLLRSSQIFPRLEKRASCGTNNKGLSHDTAAADFLPWSALADYGHSIFFAYCHTCQLKFQMPVFSRPHWRKLSRRVHETSGRVTHFKVV